MHVCDAVRRMLRESHAEAGPYCEVRSLFTLIGFAHGDTRRGISAHRAR